MEAAEQFQIISLGFIALPCLLALGLFISPWPRSAAVRAAIAIAVAWLVAVLYTMFIYNPAGIAAAAAQGVHFPEARYDNNTIASTMLGGWIYPALAILGFSIVRRAWLKVRKAGVGRGGSA